MVTCRVCQAMIDISGKRDQHVVKCVHCNEATVRKEMLTELSALPESLGQILPNSLKEVKSELDVLESDLLTEQST